MRSRTQTTLLCAAVFCTLASGLRAQDGGSGKPDANAPLTDRERMLLERVAQLEQRVEALEKKVGEDKTTSNTGAATFSTAATPLAAAAPASAPTTPAASSQAASTTDLKTPDTQPAATFLDGTTLNLNLDTYYGYNFNNPIGRVNLLRAYDVSSNAISLNQAGLVLDNQPDLTKGKRWGFRFDLQYGQATETLQGNPTNEPRPDIYRNVFQAYGTYVLPIGKGLTVDFGKFASSLGIEGNYTKDQMNYSRSFWFNQLPFYHMGARVNYKFTDWFAVNYWLVNGVQQAEPFNGYKDEFFGLTFTRGSKFSWNVNYYLGQEHPDVTYFSNGGAPPGAPMLQGVPFEPIPNAPKGKLHIFDSYATWQLTAKWTLAGEADDEIERLYESSPSSHIYGGSLYLAYQWTPKLSLAGRAEYMANRGPLFGTVDEAVKETTFTTKYQVVNGLDLFGEWRRDFSNQPFFYTNVLNVLKKEQNTATLGLVWWWGGKQGNW